MTRPVFPTEPLYARNPISPLREALNVARNVHLPGLRVGRHLTLQERFDEWLASPDGQTVYSEVVRRAVTLRARGFEHYGIAALFEAIRYDQSIALGPDAAFRLNNDYRSRLARRVMADVPQLAGFFELRGLKA